MRDTSDSNVNALKLSESDTLLREILAELRIMNDRNRAIAQAVPVIFSNLVERGKL